MINRRERNRGDVGTGSIGEYTAKTYGVTFYLATEPPTEEDKKLTN